MLTSARMRRLAVCVIVVSSAFVALSMTLGACDDSCIDTGCVQIDAGPDVKAEAGKKDAAKDAPVDSPSDAVTDATSDASEDASDASDAAAE